MPITEERQKQIANHFNNQEGQNYPCSNQIVCCGFVGDNDKWNNFVKQNRKNIIRLSRYEFTLKNNEKWVRILSPEHTRGYRYYKIKVDKNIEDRILNQYILPYCGLYCCSFEWI